MWGPSRQRSAEPVSGCSAGQQDSGEDPGAALPPGPANCGGEGRGPTICQPMLGTRGASPCILRPCPPVDWALRARATASSPVWGPTCPPQRRAGGGGSCSPALCALAPREEAGTCWGTAPRPPVPRAARGRSVSDGETEAGARTPVPQGSRQRGRLWAAARPSRPLAPTSRPPGRAVGLFASAVNICHHCPPGPNEPEEHGGCRDA